MAHDTSEAAVVARVAIAVEARMARDDNATEGLARAAIQAMREPSKDMIAAAFDDKDEGGCVAPMSGLRLNDDGQWSCPKCSSASGGDWRQCQGACPLQGSPHFQPALSYWPPARVTFENGRTGLANDVPF